MWVRLPLLNPFLWDNLMTRRHIQQRPSKQRKIN